jgi:hypothetical protein
MKKELFYVAAISLKMSTTVNSFRTPDHKGLIRVALLYWVDVYTPRCPDRSTGWPCDLQPIKRT